MNELFRLTSTANWVILGAAALLVLLLVISFRSRSYVFCQYLKAMTGISLKPKDVRRSFKAGGKVGVRELFLDLIIREDLKQGPVVIPESAGSGPVRSEADSARSDSARSG